MTTTPPPTTTPTPKPTLAPLDLVSTTATHNSVSLVWSSVPLPDSSNVMYVVEYRKSDSDKQWAVAVNSLKDNKYTVHRLDPDTSYVFNVKAVSEGGTILTQALKQVSRTTGKQPTIPIGESRKVTSFVPLKICLQRGRFLVMYMLLYVIYMLLFNRKGKTVLF